MTPVVLLVGFCATMSVIAIGRLVVGDRDPVEVGSALVVVGITLLTTLWAALEETWFTTAGRTLVAIAGTAVVSTGLVVIVRYWTGTADGVGRGRTRPAGDDADRDGERDGA